jgi:DNA-binding CsgD family transcriptional regulator
MRQLGAKDLEAALEFALEAQAAESVDELRRRLLPRLRGLVPCHVLGYNEIDLGRGQVLGILDPPDAGFDGIDRQFLSVIDQHPLVKVQRAGDLSVRALSDFLTVRQFHRLELYNDFYRLIDAEDQLAFGIPGDVMVAFVLCRSGRDFKPRDRQLLELVRPHLALAYGQARECERVNALLRALESGLEERDVAVLQLDLSGQLTHATGAATELLEAYFGPGAVDRHALPSGIAKWLRNDTSHDLTLDGPRGRLRVREQRHERSGDWRMLVLDESRVCPPSIESLRDLGLTRRQAQVLRLVACGKTSRRIAQELQISTATVSKHLEHIYDRLGVSTRTQAISRIR